MLFFNKKKKYKEIITKRVENNLAEKYQPLIYHVLVNVQGNSDDDFYEYVSIVLIPLVSDAYDDMCEEHEELYHETMREMRKYENDEVNFRASCIGFETLVKFQTETMWLMSLCNDFDLNALNRTDHKYVITELLRCILKENQLEELLDMTQYDYATFTGWEGILYN